MPAGTPGELVEAVRGLAAPAQALGSRCGSRSNGSSTAWSPKHQLTGQRDRLVVHALHTSETWLRNATGPGISEHGLARIPGGCPAAGRPPRHAPLWPAHPVGAQPSHGPPPLPDTPSYQARTLFLPHERVGDAWFGGDWFGGQQASDGSLWVLITDITGHGYFAYLLASTMPCIWQKCWPLAAHNHCEPADLLAAMHQCLGVLAGKDFCRGHLDPPGPRRHRHRGPGGR